MVLLIADPRAKIDATKQQQSTESSSIPEPSTPAQDSHKPRQKQPRTQTPRHPSGGAPAEDHSTPEISSSNPLSPQPGLASGVKRTSRKHQHTVSFGSPLAQQIESPSSSTTTTNHKATSPSSQSPASSRLHHRRQSSSTSSGFPPATSASQLALIQQRYAADQHAVLQQRILQEQLASASNLPHRGNTSRHQQTAGGETIATNNQARGVPAAFGEGLRAPATVRSGDPAEHLSADTQAQILRQLQEAQGHPSQPTSLTSYSASSVPMTQSSSHLDPNDIQQTNNALAHQLSILRLMNEYKNNKEGQPTGISHEALVEQLQQSQAHLQRLGYVPNLGSGLNMGNDVHRLSASFANPDAGHNPGVLLRTCSACDELTSCI